ncbi:gas vesicle protein GvpA [Halogeometricum pallidum JCM 14848]|uniref:Gas vesicle protein GvpA n=1 Tax=Halogeometricum pallidum JCM 14848 TaxID=1227487 RepID=M0CWF5_HALPD|nr:gas vesicle protein GvpA [Halogeometricum pallidum JCM 14848]
MPDPVKPGRDSDSLADVVELLLDKGVVLNADIVVSVGETELLGIRLRAALASFETASEFGLEFPSGTDMEAVEAASKRRRRAKMSPSGRPGLEEGEGGDDEDEDREDRSVDVMNATIGREESEQSADGSESGAEADGEGKAEDERDDQDGTSAENGNGDEVDDGEGEDG